MALAASGLSEHRRARRPRSRYLTLTTTREVMAAGHPGNRRLQRDRRESAFATEASEVTALSEVSGPSEASGVIAASELSQVIAVSRSVASEMSAASEMTAALGMTEEIAIRQMSRIGRSGDHRKIVTSVKIGWRAAEAKVIEASVVKEAKVEAEARAGLEVIEALTAENGVAKVGRINEMTRSHARRLIFLVGRSREMNRFIAHPLMLHVTGRSSKSEDGRSCAGAKSCRKRTPARAARPAMAHGQWAATRGEVKDA
mmetsp:Transcript_144990/g.263708  ORF Transcript_144990/g.263708 Transcript_144990/m.263708 type:complete len:258 (+) Transcript_144990:1904-2677(+)